MHKPHNILISRTDSIGDVVLTLPMAGIIKQKYPDCRIVFLGQNYTRDVVGLSKYVDEFIDWKSLSEVSLQEQIKEIKKRKIDTVIHVFPKKEIAKLMRKAHVRTRIGTSHRIFHWLNCNRLLNFSRKKSNLHEAQLNVKLLSPLGIKESFSLEQLNDFYGFESKYSTNDEIKNLISCEKKNIILHPKSKGSAREWGLENFAALIRILPQEKYNIFLSGTEEEGQLFRSQMVEPFPHIHDLSGKLSLAEFIAFIKECDALVAASTGPLHLAASLGIFALGLYPPKKPIHPGRWRPIGKHTKVLVLNKSCSNCKVTNYCACLMDLTPTEVKKALNEGLNC